MPINEWWRGDDSERYWVEITDRDDLGADLNIPTRNSTGGRYSGYELINFIEPGEVVFHWHKRMAGAPALVAWSVATGIVEDTVTDWQARGTYGQAAPTPPSRPAWLMPLVDYTPLDPIVTYDEIKSLETQIREIESDLKQARPGPLYFPFTFSDTQGIRPAQTYLAKFPRALAELLQTAEVSTELLSGDKEQRQRGAAPTPAHQGYLRDSRVRSAIERRAVELAIAWYESHHYSVDYTGSTKPYDLEVTQGDEVRRVEIKGTIGLAESVELTIGEVDNARESTPVDLFVVHGIHYERLADGNARGFGGSPRLWEDWTPAEASLEAIRFRHQPPTTGFILADAE